MNNPLQEAQRIAGYIPGFIERQGLSASALRGFTLAVRGSSVWLFAEIDTKRVRKLADYTNPALMHHLSTDLEGRPVIVSNSTGLRWAVLLGEPPKLPGNAPAPAHEPNRVHLGVNYRGERISSTWDEMGHSLYAGITRSGKTNAMRLVINQAIQDGHRLVIVDPDGRSFAYLSGHPALLLPVASGLEASAAALVAVFQELERRQRLFAEAGATIDTIDAYNAKTAAKLPRLIVVVDEFPSLILAHGGTSSPFAQNIFRLSMNTLKFGVHLLLGAQDATKEVLGGVVDQCATRLCFRVQRPETSKIVVRRTGAERIGKEMRGRCLSDQHGLLQTYLAGDLAHAATLTQPTPPAQAAMFSPAQTREQAAELRTAELAEKIRPILEQNPKISKRALCRVVLNQQYGGSYATQLDAALALLSATTAENSAENTVNPLRAAPEPA